MAGVSERDLEHVLATAEDVFKELENCCIFITGGTGFFGCWLLETFVFANRALDLRARAVVLMRDPEAFARKAPHLARHPAVKCCQGDVRSFPFPADELSYIIHASAESNVSVVRRNPLLLFETHLEGARRVFDLAVERRVKGVLFTSSGAVYGKQPVELIHIPETSISRLESLGSDAVKMANSGGIWTVELLANLYQQQHNMPAKIARCFTFIGPYLPLSKPFAATSFLRDALAHKPVEVSGDGTAYRSYLYAADLTIWLWHILVRGQSGAAYNVGSEEEISVGNLAGKIAQLVGQRREVRLGQQPRLGATPERYVPSTRKAREELGLRQWVSLDDAIERTAEWHRQQSQ